MESEYDEDLHAGIRAAPLFELSSVCVDSLNNNEVADGQPLRIYGVIAVLKDGEHDDIIELYNRFRDDPEELWLGDKLSLKGPITHSAKPLRVGVYLRDVVRGVQIASGIFTVEYKTQQDYDVCKTVTVDGEFGSATIRYKSYFSAMVGVVKVKITKLKDDGNEYIGVCGSISTRVGDGYSQRMTPDDKDDCVLFKRHPANAFSLLSRYMINLSRSSVVVPAGSFLWIMVDLKDAHTNCIIAKSKLKLRVDEHFTNYQEMVEDDFHTQLTLRWMHPYELSYLEINKVKELPIELTDSGLAQSEGGEQDCLEKRPSMVCKLRSLSEPLQGMPLVEVFSVYVDCINRKFVGINGVVELHDRFGTYSIFREDHNDRDVLREREARKKLPKRSRTKLSLLRGVITRCVKFEDFSVTLKLKDEKNRAISNGYADWGDDAKDYMSWYDKPICSVFKGDSGFSTVHYSIFKEAVEARFIVALSSIHSDDVSSTVVSGSITARYKNFDYSTYYAQEFYQSIIFEEHEEKPISLMGRSEVFLPLSKIVVPVPIKSSLIVNVDLVVVDGHTLERRVVQGVIEFDPFLTVAERIRANGFEVVVWCTWNPLRDV